MLSGPTVPPTTEQPIAGFSAGSETGWSEDELPRRMEQERLRSEVLMLCRQRAALCDRLNELEATLDAKEEQLSMATDTIEQQDRQLQAIVDRYETILDERANSQDSDAGTGGSAIVQQVTSWLSPRPDVIPIGRD